MVFAKKRKIQKNKSSFFLYNKLRLDCNLAGSGTIKKRKKGEVETVYHNDTS